MLAIRYVSNKKINGEHGGQPGHIADGWFCFGSTENAFQLGPMMQKLHEEYGCNGVWADDQGQVYITEDDFNRLVKIGALKKQPLWRRLIS